MNFPECQDGENGSGCVPFKARTKEDKKKEYLRTYGALDDFVPFTKTEQSVEDNSETNAISAEVLRVVKKLYVHHNGQTRYPPVSLKYREELINEINTVLPLTSGKLKELFHDVRSYHLSWITGVKRSSENRILFETHFTSRLERKLAELKSTK